MREREKGKVPLHRGSAAAVVVAVPHYQRVLGARVCTHAHALTRLPPHAADAGAGGAAAGAVAVAAATAQQHRRRSFTKLGRF